jgi:hypothetical protein
MLGDHSAMRNQGSSAMLREQNVVYYPEDLIFLGSVFDQAIASMPPAMRTPSNKAAIARSILMLAAAGERDSIKIKQAALIKVAVASIDLDAPKSALGDVRVVQRHFHTLRPERRRAIASNRAGPWRC